MQTGHRTRTRVGPPTVHWHERIRGRSKSDQTGQTFAEEASGSTTSLPRRSPRSSSTTLGDPAKPSADTRSMIGLSTIGCASFHLHIRMSIGTQSVCCFVPSLFFPPSHPLFPRFAIDQRNHQKDERLSLGLTHRRTTIKKKKKNARRGSTLYTRASLFPSPSAASTSCTLLGRSTDSEGKQVVL